MTRINMSSFLVPCPLWITLQVSIWAEEEVLQRAINANEACNYRGVRQTKMEYFTSVDLESSSGSALKTNQFY